MDAVNRETITQLGNLIADIEDREDLPPEDIRLLWEVYDILRRPDQIPATDDRDREYCDACGEELTGARVSYAEMPIDIASANAGESAVICSRCHVALIQKLDESDSDCDPNTGIPYGEIS